MITVRPFTIENVKTHRGFYLLRHIADVSELQIVHNTPAGPVEVDVVDAFSMPNGAIIIAWKSALSLSPMHNLTAIHGQVTENVSILPVERVIDIYGRPVDAQVGAFVFMNSDMILAPSIDWRCDNGKYGPVPFQTNMRVIDQLSDISVYEPVLSVNGVGHLIYIEGVAKQDVTNDFLSTGELPTVGRTLWETLKIIREWAIVNQEPFNNTEAVAHKAFQFIKELKFTDDELSVIDQQIPMQIANYLTGNSDARRRPDGILPITDQIKNILFSRLSSGSVSALEYMNPGMWDLEELLIAENNQLQIDRIMFKALEVSMSPDRPVIAIQHRFFDNKQLILDRVRNNGY
jgi:hypothetical protein